MQNESSDYKTTYCRTGRHSRISIYGNHIEYYRTTKKRRCSYCRPYQALGVFVDPLDEVFLFHGDPPKFKSILGYFLKWVRLSIPALYFWSWLYFESFCHEYYLPHTSDRCKQEEPPNGSRHSGLDPESTAL